MASFFQFETKDIPFQLSYDDPCDPEKKVLDGYKEVVITLTQGQRMLVKKTDELGIDVENDIINMHLSQEETGSFKTCDQVKVQLNVYYNNHERDISSKLYLEVKETDYKEVMS